MPAENQELCQIKNFKEFLEEHLKQQMLEFTLKPLTDAGDNYGSIMQSVEIKLVKGDVIHAVVKTPVTNPFLVTVFQPELSFVKENHYYSDIIPAVKQLEEKRNVPNDERIDAFIQCIGSRSSLDGDAKRADVDAILMLENIKYHDYDNVDRLVGFDIEETQEILKQLAKVHSSCIAVRRLEPEMYNSKIKPFLEPVNFHNNPAGKTNFEALIGRLHYIEGLDSQTLNDVENHLRISFDWSLTTNDVADTPYSTVVHRDLWCNNVMIRRNNSLDNPVNVKIYDYQVFFYESFVYDLIFFVCTSPKSDILKTHFKTLFEFYLDEFRKSMELLKYPLEEYSNEKMWSEIRKTAKMEIAHIFIMTLIIFVEKNEINDMESFEPSDLFKTGKPSDSILNRWKLVIDLFVENELF